MRRFVTSLALAAAGMLALTALPVSEAHASPRIYVDFGDVFFSAGRPYDRYSRAPLHVVHYDYGPRYYHYGPPARVVHHYAPPPRVRHVYHHHPGRGYGPPRHHRSHRDDRRGDWDRGRDRGRDRDRRRGRGRH